jgi:hypothetical protein
MIVDRLGAARHRLATKCGAPSVLDAAGHVEVLGLGVKDAISSPVGALDGEGVFSTRIEPRATLEGVQRRM